MIFLGQKEKEKKKKKEEKNPFIGTPLFFMY